MLRTPRDSRYLPPPENPIQNSPLVRDLSAQPVMRLNLIQAARLALNYSYSCAILAIHAGQRLPVLQAGVRLPPAVRPRTSQRTGVAAGNLAARHAEDSHGIGAPRHARELALGDDDLVI